ncbi:MAG: hypothetical protein IKJ57_06770 [Oscillospiraceae bacterium]|nr:hypothetical protein [Oscillospiraceae bacterium]
MYFIIMGAPLAIIFAVLQYMLCKKARGNIIKLLPIFAAAASLLLAGFIRGENFLADAVYGIFGQGIFALVVVLWIFGGGVAVGAIIGWIIYLVKVERR